MFVSCLPVCHTTVWNINVRKPVASELWGQGGTLYPQVQDLYSLYLRSQRFGLCQNFKQTNLTTRLYKVRTNLYPPPHLRRRSDAPAENKRLTINCKICDVAISIQGVVGLSITVLRMVHCWVCQWTFSSGEYLAKLHTRRCMVVSCTSCAWHAPHR